MGRGRVLFLSIMTIALVAMALGSPAPSAAAAALAPPPNDPILGAIDPVTLGFSQQLSTLEATFEAGEPSPTCEVGETFLGRTVWYKYTPTANTLLTADTLGSSFDTVVAVYSGPVSSPTFAGLSFVGCDDEYDDSQSGVASLFTFPAAAGTTYYIQAGGYFAESGDMNFHLDIPNNPLAGAMDAATPPFAFSQTTADASTEPGEPNPICEFGQTNIGRSVWYRYSPMVNTVVTADTLGSDYDTVLAVYSGSASSPTYAGLSFVGCDDEFDDSNLGVPSRFTFAAAGGTTYYFQAGGFLGEFGNLQFHLNADADGDGANDGADNCPQWANPSQSLPPWPVDPDDPDCDGFSTSREMSMGTAPLRQCPSGGVPDAWPPDTNLNGAVSVTDVLFLKPYFNQSVPPAPARYDLFVNGGISISDVLEFKDFINRSCS